MNAAQWLAAIFLVSVGYSIGWFRGFAVAKYEYFYRGKLAARREMDTE